MHILSVCGAVNIEKLPVPISGSKESYIYSGWAGCALINFKAEGLQFK